MCLTIHGQLSWYHLHLLMPRDISLFEYFHTLARSRGPPAEFYFRTRRFLLAASGFFSQQVHVRAFHQLPILWTRQQLLLAPSRLLLYAVVIVLVSI